MSFIIDSFVCLLLLYSYLSLYMLSLASVSDCWMEVICVAFICFCFVYLVVLIENGAHLYHHIFLDNRSFFDLLFACQLSWNGADEL